MGRTKKKDKLAKNKIFDSNRCGNNLFDSTGTKLITRARRIFLERWRHLKCLKLQVVCDADAIQEIGVGRLDCMNTTPQTGFVSGIKSKRVGRPDGISTSSDWPARSDDNAVVYDVLSCVVV